MRQWTATPMPLLQGEDSANTPYLGNAPFRVENGLYVSPGAIQQVPDWRVGDTCTDGSAENDAVCGIFPFATQGGASAASAGLMFSFDTSANKIWLHQVGEDHAILRTLDTGYSYVESAPPQMTGFEYFGQFIVNLDGRQTVANRLGLGIYDPVANTFTIPTPDPGSGATLLKFRGIANHLGGTCIGWGFLDGAGTVDAPHALRGSRYGEADLSLDTAWAPDDTDTGPWVVNVGQLGVPIVGCAPSGATTIIGKATEVYALSGDFIGQLGYNYIGKHGPVSITGIVSTGPLAVWMTDIGPAYSENGGRVQLIARNRIARRMQTYYDLTYCSAVHDSTRTRVGFLLRRQSTLQGVPLSAAWGDEILWWDYERDQITIQGTPTTCFCLGTTRGPGTDLAGPSGAPANLAASTTSNSASLSWDHSTGDPTAQVSVEYKPQADSTYMVVGPADAGALSWLLSALSPSTAYDWRLRYYKNGQYGSYATSTFTTAAGSAVGTPTNLAGEITSIYTSGSKTYSVSTISWTRGEFAAGSRTQVFIAATSSFASAAQAWDVASSQTSVTTEQLVASPPEVRYFWVRHTLLDGTVGTEVGPVSVSFVGAL